MTLKQNPSTFSTHQNHKLIKPTIMKSVLHFATLLLLITVVTSCGNKDSLEGKKKELSELKKHQEETVTKIKKLEIEIAKLDPKAVSVAKTRNVKVTEIVAGKFNHYVQVQGSVVADENVMANAKTPGIVTRVFVREGDNVSKGQILAQQDVSVITQSMAELKTGIELAEDIYNRRKSLWDQKIGTEVDFMIAKNNKESLEKKMATLKSQIALSSITSPISGIVDAVNIKEGEVASPGYGIIRVVNLDKVKISAKVADNYLGSIKQGDNLDVRLPDINKTISASINFVSKSVDAISRTFIVEASVSQAKDLRPNQIAILQINDRAASGVISIDENLVQNTDNGSIVYVTEDKGGKLVSSMRIIKIGQSYNGRVEVVEGLKVGDKLITFGFEDLVQDTPIAIEPSASVAK
jgi:RND family efflux transporter MFP subunit